MGEALITTRGGFGSKSGGGNKHLVTEVITQNQIWYKPGNIADNNVSVRIFGGGGGGYRYAGGGGGYMNNAILDLSAYSQVPIVIGIGGQGGILRVVTNNDKQSTHNKNATNGGTTSFGALLAANGGEGARYGVVAIYTNNDPYLNDWIAGSGGSGGGGGKGGSAQYGGGGASKITPSGLSGYVNINCWMSNGGNGGIWGGGGAGAKEYNANNFAWTWWGDSSTGWWNYYYYYRGNGGYGGKGGTYGGDGGCYRNNGNAGINTTGMGLDFEGQGLGGIYENHAYYNSNNNANNFAWGGGGGGYGGNGGSHCGGGGGYGADGGNNAGGGGGYGGKGGDNYGGGGGYGPAGLGGNSSVPNGGYGAGGGVGIVNSVDAGTNILMNQSGYGGNGICILQYYVKD